VISLIALFHSSSFNPFSCKSSFFLLIFFFWGLLDLSNHLLTMGEGFFLIKIKIPKKRPAFWPNNYFLSTFLLFKILHRFNITLLLFIANSFFGPTNCIYVLNPIFQFFWCWFFQCLGKQDYHNRKWYLFHQKHSSYQYLHRSKAWNFVFNHSLQTLGLFFC